MYLHDTDNSHIVVKASYNTMLLITLQLDKEP